MRYVCTLALALTLYGCGGGSDDTQTQTQAANPTPIAQPVQVFTSDMAKANLVFAKNQYSKLLESLQDPTKTSQANRCNSSNTCFPRAMEEDTVFLDRPQAWTNGFWPGVFWKLLSAQDSIENFSDSEIASFETTALTYTDALRPDANRTNTHDLGFIIYDSFAEALEYSKLTDEKREEYLQIIERARTSLASRYSPEFDVIRSWDWTPRLRISYLENETPRTSSFDLAAPWQYPVIIDNMMNLELLLSGDNAMNTEIAIEHATQTYNNHYFFGSDDTQQLFPIAYHVYDYSSQRPGNWQGLGNISAWARGQAWSLYGFATMAEFAVNNPTLFSNELNFVAIADEMASSVEKLLDEQYVPDWDFFASHSNAADVASNTSIETTRYSRILDLCDYKISDNILPYNGYQPIQYSTSLLSQQSVARLSSLKSIENEDFIIGDVFTPCGTTPYDLTQRDIPKDSSAAAIMAAGFYRLAQATTSADTKQKYTQLGDNILKALTDNYLTSKNNGTSFELGFVLDEATGNMPNGSEVNTSIVYADFYFIEANIRKIQLEKQ